MSDYSPALVTQVQYVQFLLQDGTPNAQQTVLQVSEIAKALTDNGWNDGLALCATAIASYYAGMVRQGSEKDSSRAWGDRADYYTKFAFSARQGAYPDPTTPIRDITQIVTAKTTDVDPDCELLGDYSPWRPYGLGGYGNSGDY